MTRTAASDAFGDTLIRASFVAAMSGLRLDGESGGVIGVAVSGGGDSMALLHLSAEWARARNVALTVLTVDHQLRPESAAEAEFVARAAADLGAPHVILRWRGGAERGTGGNIQARAREGRYALLAAWAHEADAAVALAHTLDDQAETFLMRLARGSGVDGLSAMPPAVERGGARFIRPLLGARRWQLRDLLGRAGATWIEDPSNDDPRYDRVKARRALAELGPLGLDAPRLASTAATMAQARAALETATEELAARAVRRGALGEARIALAPLAAAPREIALRLLADALRAASGAPYRPRLDALEALLDAALRSDLGGGRTLHGCLIRAARGAATVLREPAAVAAPVAAEAGAVWDGRWRLIAAPEDAGAPSSEESSFGGQNSNASGCEGLCFGALGEAGAEALRRAARAGQWTAPPVWRRASAAARLTSPALWRGQMLICSPHAEYGRAVAVVRAGATIRPDFGAGSG